MWAAGAVVFTCLESHGRVTSIGGRGAERHRRPVRGWRRSWQRNALMLRMPCYRSLHGGCPRVMTKEAGNV